MNKKLRKKKKGFTLVELVVVIAILGILAGIAVPKFGSVQTNAANVAHNANIRILQSAAMMYMAEHGTGNALTATAAETALSDYVQAWPTIPNGAQQAKSGSTTENESITATKYEVTIDANGVVAITPPAANVNN